MVELKKQIEDTRDKLNILITNSKEKINSSELLEVSQILDELINAYIKLT
ncbi:Spo0E family sporulation regulatory protein-aspartic acid phosphatase [Clostridium chromiireducens]|uniref:Spo0E family sporulation regulatory protein-aspartic acid phosphatase n=1 Tax=Clostridium chromiireducens TaxID=225345 RepID=A0A964W2Z8_9CLOT|nr:aspartyl-phosphate phosphatase Spo0E family protein [Clostridium chromiireducens]MVX64597.1 Spo0E family sporulation regulatory protein-aspartic acid phosphatase [Clostridium chromiireducens]